MKKKETEFHKIWELSKEDGEKIKKEIESGEMTPIMIADEENIPYKNVVISIHPKYLKQYPDSYSAMKMLSTRNLKTGKIKGAVTKEYHVDDSELPNKKVVARKEDMTIEEYEKTLKALINIFEKDWWCKIRIFDYSDCKTSEEVMRKMEKQ